MMHLIIFDRNQGVVAQWFSELSMHRFYMTPLNIKSTHIFSYIGTSGSAILPLSAARRNATPIVQTVFTVFGDIFMTQRNVHSGELYIIIIIPQVTCACKCDIRVAQKGTLQGPSKVLPYGAPQGPCSMHALMYKNPPTPLYLPLHEGLK